MIQVISRDRWNSAQVDELIDYDYVSVDAYEKTHNIILHNYFGIDPKKDLVGKTVIEPGGGSWPAIYFCTGLKRAVNVEPLLDNFPSYVTSKLTERNIELVSMPFEDYSDDVIFDELWMFNLLTHVITPKGQIDKAKRIAKNIRIFEPLNTAINNEHPHTMTVEFFDTLFPNIEKNIHKGGSIPGFHGADCIYFTWSKQ